MNDSELVVACATSDVVFQECARQIAGDGPKRLSIGRAGVPPRFGRALAKRTLPVRLGSTSSRSDRSRCAASSPS